jgi:hypothetical protein
MMLSPTDIVFIMVSMLSANNMPKDKIEAQKPDLVKLATAISQDSDPLTLIGVSYTENRFKLKGSSSKGACGPFQQIPKWSPIATTCAELQSNPEVAVKVAKASLSKVWKRWDKDIQSLCHYNSGNKCYSRSLKYSREVWRSIKWAKRISKKKIEIKVPYTNSHMKFHIVDEKVRASLGLPPLSL